LRVTEALENNRFGDVAEELRRGENRLKIEPPSSGKIANKREDEARDKRQGTEGEIGAGCLVSVADKEVEEEAKDGKEEESVEVEERRFAFWAARGWDIALRVRYFVLSRGRLFCEILF
jgi:hypothetical protein